MRSVLPGFCSGTLDRCPSGTLHALRVPIDRYADRQRWSATMKPLDPSCGLRGIRGGHHTKRSSSALCSHCEVSGVGVLEAFFAWAGDGNDLPIRIEILPIQTPTLASRLNQRGIFLAAHSAAAPVVNNEERWHYSPSPSLIIRVHVSTKLFLFQTTLLPISNGQCLVLPPGSKQPLPAELERIDETICPGDSVLARFGAWWVGSRDTHLRGAFKSVDITVPTGARPDRARLTAFYERAPKGHQRIPGLITPLDPIPNAGVFHFACTRSSNPSRAMSMRFAVYLSTSTGTGTPAGSGRVITPSPM